MLLGSWNICGHVTANGRDYGYANDGNIQLRKMFRSFTLQMCLRCLRVLLIA